MHLSMLLKTKSLPNNACSSEEQFITTVHRKTINDCVRYIELGLLPHSNTRYMFKCQHPPSTGSGLPGGILPHAADKRIPTVQANRSWYLKISTLKYIVY